MAISEVKNLTGGAVRGVHVKLFIAFEPYFLSETLNLGGLGSNPARPTTNTHQAHEFTFVGFLLCGQCAAIRKKKPANTGSRVLLDARSGCTPYRLPSDVGTDELGVAPGVMRESFLVPE